MEARERLNTAHGFHQIISTGLNELGKIDILTTKERDIIDKLLQKSFDKFDLVDGEMVFFKN